MKKQTMRRIAQISLLAVFAMVAAVGSAHAQSLGVKIRVNIPFDFLVADETFPAGEYLVGRAREDNSDTVIEVTDVKGGVSAFRLSRAVWTIAPKDKATLVFNRYGDQYFLSEVWPSGANTGRVLLRGSSEQEARNRTLAAGTPVKSETVNVAGSQQ